MTRATRNQTTLAGRRKIGRLILLIYGQVALAVASFLCLPALVFPPRTDAWRVLLAWVLSCVLMFFASRVSSGSTGWRRYFARVPWIAAAFAGLGVFRVVVDAYWGRRPHSITEYEAAWLIASVSLFALAGWLRARARIWDSRRSLAIPTSRFHVHSD
jgi:hypothetical protein